MTTFNCFFGRTSRAWSRGRPKTDFVINFSRIFSRDIRVFSWTGKTVLLAVFRILSVGPWGLFHILVLRARGDFWEGERDREREREKGAVRYDIMSAANPRRAKDVNDCGFSGTGLSLSLCSLSILCYLSLSFSKYSEIIKKRVINSTAVLEATGPLSIYLYIFFFLFFLYLHFFSLALFLYIHLYLSIGILSPYISFI